jgi:hypothetical protein
MVLVTGLCPLKGADEVSGEVFLSFFGSIEVGNISQLSLIILPMVFFLNFFGASFYFLPPIFLDFSPFLTFFCFSFSLYLSSFFLGFLVFFFPHRMLFL